MDKISNVAALTHASPHVTALDSAGNARLSGNVSKASQSQVAADNQPQSETGKISIHEAVNKIEKTRRSDKQRNQILGRRGNRY